MSLQNSVDKKELHEKAIVAFVSPSSFEKPLWILLIVSYMSNQQTKHSWLKNNLMFSTNPCIQFSDISSDTTLIIKELLVD